MFSHSGQLDSFVSNESLVCIEWLFYDSNFNTQNQLKTFKYSASGENSESGKVSLSNKKHV